VAKEKRGDKHADELAGLKVGQSLTPGSIRLTLIVTFSCLRPIIIGIVTCYTSPFPILQSTDKLHVTRDEPTDEIAQGATSLWWRNVVLDFAVIPQPELPKGVYYGVVFTSFCINVPKYLKYLLNTSTAAGGKVIRQDLPADNGFGAALAAAEGVAGERVHAFVNATGLGARSLLSDGKMFPTRGQTVLVKGEASGARTRVGKGYTAYCIPRPGSGTTIVGGTKQAGDW